MPSARPSRSKNAARLEFAGSKSSSTSAANASRSPVQAGREIGDPIEPVARPGDDERIRAEAAGQLVVAVTAREKVLAAPSEQPIAAGIAAEHVGAQAAIEEIVVATAGQQIVAAEADQLVVAAEVEDAVRIVGPVQTVVAEGADDLCDCL